MLMDLRPHNSLLGSGITAAQELVFVEPSGALGADPGSINGSTITPMH